LFLKNPFQAAMQKKNFRKNIRKIIRKIFSLSFSVIFFKFYVVAAIKVLIFNYFSPQSNQSQRI